MSPSPEAFARELDAVLPADLPHRDLVVRDCAAHLALIDDANRNFNLTRISSPHEAAVKHVLDSLIPWRLFERAKRVLDAGTGAGFPGVPLAIALPGTRFMLAESVQKKARFVEAVASRLGLANVAVEPRRAEELAREGGFEVITMRALAPVERAIDLFEAALRRGARLLLYKGPDAAREIAEALRRPNKKQPNARIAMSYELPEKLGIRNVIEIAF